MAWFDRKSNQVKKHEWLTKALFQEPKTVHTVELENFSVESLFTSENLGQPEGAIEDVKSKGVGLGLDGLMDVGKSYGSGTLPDNELKKTAYQKVIEGKKEKRKRKKNKRADEMWKAHGHLPQRSAVKKYIINSQRWKTTCRLECLRAKAGGYCAKPSGFKEMKEVDSVEEAVDRGFTIIECNGFDRPIVDSQGRVLAVLIPSPDDPSYQESVKKAFLTMQTQSEIGDFGWKDLNHKRGRGFAAINVGLSYGIGHLRPSRPDLGGFEGIASTLTEDINIQRLAAFQDAMYAFWHPKAYRYYKTNLDKLWEVYPELSKPLFPRSIMPTVAFNLGERVTTKIHVDPMNCPFGWCVVTALGNFDSSRGGHLILWELGLVLEFPAGACICLPSAIISHSNIPTHEGESRMSFTQYCSGEIFRYIENGFRTDRIIEEEDPAIFLFRKDRRKKRLQEGYLMFSTIADLIQGIEG